MWFEEDEDLTQEITNELPVDDGDDAGGGDDGGGDAGGDDAGGGDGGGGGSSW